MLVRYVGTVQYAPKIELKYGMLVRYGSRCEVRSTQILNVPYRTAILDDNQIQKTFLLWFRKISATHSYTTRNAVIDKFYIPKTLHVKTDQSIRVTGPKIWNALPRIAMEKSDNVPLFKKLIKSHFLLEQN